MTLPIRRQGQKRVDKWNFIIINLKKHFRYIEIISTSNYSYIIKASSLLKNSYSIIDKEQELEFSTSLIGDFQIKNILLVYSILKELNINIINFSKFIKET